MSGELRARHMEGERWKMEARLADPPSTLEGECWIRPDLAPEPDQLGTLRVDVGNSTLDVPIFAGGTSSADIEESLRIQLNNDVGYVPLAPLQSATYPELRVQQSSGTYGMHDAVEVSAIPDSGGTHQWDHDEGSGTTLADRIGSLGGAINGATWATGAGTNDTHLDYDGADDYTDLGTASQSELAHFVNNGTGTLGFWVNADAVDGSSYAVAGTAFAFQRGFVLQINAQDQWRWAMFNSSDYMIAGESITTDATGDANDWVFIAATADGTNTSLYIARPGDGYTVTEAATDTISGTESGDLEQNVNIGRETDQARWQWDGGMDLAFTDSGAQSQSELQSFVDDSKSFYQ